MPTPTKRFRIPASEAIFLTLCLGHGLTMADEVSSRNGLEPLEQAKVNRVLARERLRAAQSTSAAAQAGNTQPASGRLSSGLGSSQDCTTNIGTVSAENSRPGVRGPSENIIVIKAPVVNKC